ncbi:hypothetical protein ACE66E_001706 [Campylobacter jejuni]|uniref:Uncharacterized protein n=2 Tax=Campylobacter jejuni subsp. jejuni serotype O:23/36 (strain 81-176) TaxID=354242 RepID=A0A0H3P965_CAMJJ|nr:MULTISPECIES: hypothetical protein [Campylobacter]ETJ81733.1 hypothetical protein X908_08075 [Campylobacter jejuni subsp. jejuni 81-176-DRH212]ETN89816.1 hypothetical protein X910_08975 [Campylobacter jejuni subsp. jejuni 81-176-UMCW9]AJK83790.1 hypothetical protein PJ19_09640 [Campylobacter jejuni subsp. jejuni]AJK85674.1 hypothetical protein PJ16_09655 [Campylobacter jejuni subsp. jejuni]AMP66163.1 hypothetical protein A0W68_09600 [Campylobacter jejuni]
MKSIFQKILTLILISPIFLFGADGGNIASKLANSVNQQITEAGSSVASIINTISIVMGVIWITVMLLMTFINMEAIKNHAKLLFGAVVIIGIIYGLSSASM